MTTTHPISPSKGWREDPAANPRQLTHAVEPGHTIAFCGMHVDISGDPWLSNATRAPLTRCPVCATAVGFLDSRSDLST
jgi:hypothetical protein